MVKGIVYYCLLVGLSNIYYTLSLKKEARYTLGDFQPRGRIGVLLYSRMYCFNCLCRSSFAYKKAAVSGGLLLQGFGVANDDAGESVAAY